MNMRKVIWLALALAQSVLLASCDIIPGLETISEQNPVTTPDDEHVGMSELERAADKIVLTMEACCVTPGHAYTAWWVIGDVTKSMDAAKTELAEGWVAESEQVELTLELEAGADGIKDPLGGVRIAILDHGQDTGDPRQLTAASGGCPNLPMCPVVLSISHAGPDQENLP